MSTYFECCYLLNLLLMSLDFSSLISTSSWKNLFSCLYLLHFHLLSHIFQKAKIYYNWTRRWNSIALDGIRNSSPIFQIHPNAEKIFHDPLVSAFTILLSPRFALCSCTFSFYFFFSNSDSEHFFFIFHFSSFDVFFFFHHPCHLADFLEEQFSDNLLVSVCYTTTAIVHLVNGKVTKCFSLFFCSFN